MVNAHKLKLKREEKQKTRPDSYSISEQHQIVNDLKGEQFLFQVLFNLQLCAGVRKGELLALHWQDIDFDNNEVNINKSLIYIPKKGCNLEPTKNGKSRIVNIDDITKELLLELKKSRECWLNYYRW